LSRLAMGKDRILQLSASRGNWWRVRRREVQVLARGCYHPFPHPPVNDGMIAIDVANLVRAGACAPVPAPPGSPAFPTRTASRVCVPSRGREGRCVASFRGWTDFPRRHDNGPFLRFNSLFLPAESVASVSTATKLRYDIDHSPTVPSSGPKNQMSWADACAPLATPGPPTPKAVGAFP
jgi:hypothetical protein